MSGGDKPEAPSAALSRAVFHASAQTEAAQALASDPAVSAWVSANAGSGKTTVLVNRVLRLLLAGVSPSRIVCLTYTKAAAANMKIRLFNELRQWASVPEDVLSDRLGRLAGHAGDAPPPAILRRARTLFATALETPGGLKIDTIHGFCTRLLQSAPFEANVPSRFEIVQDAGFARLMDEAVRDVLLEAAATPGGALALALARVAQDTGEDGFDTLAEQINANRAVLVDEEGALLPLEDIAARIDGALDVPPGETGEALAARFMARELSSPRLSVMAEILMAGTNKTDREQGAQVAALCRVSRFDDALPMLKAMFHIKGGARRKKFVTDKFLEAEPDTAAELETLFETFDALVQSLKSLAAATRTRALMQVAHAVLARLDELKSRRGLLDFEDIILRTRSLLTRVDASWVLYRLDAGIDHVLIDEAQDTSGTQWDIITAITADFFSGQGASEHGASPASRRRTVFAVGDEKQSIYSFQKAEPAAFDGMARHFAGRIGKIAEAGHRFARIRLDQSFRSTEEVMTGVDLIFAPPAHHKGLVFEQGLAGPTHSTARQGGSGAIDLWPLEEDDPAMERQAWDDPVDAASSAAVKLAMRIAAVLKRWTEAGFDDLARPFRPGDVLILMRTRSALFQAVVRELKQAGVPVAGIDRLDVSSHVAVEDMLAIAAAALLPQDDLTLATALKTPVHGCGDDDLLRLAPGRTGSLRAALRGAAATDARLAALDLRLHELEGRAARKGPFGFFACLLGPEGGRKAMLSRLGAEAGDALDAFLALALDFERRNGPSLRLFLQEMKGAGQEIKRDLAEGSGEVRVMTVHGAKGLEAPLVIIPDLGEPARSGSRRTLFECGAMQANMVVTAPIWVPRKEMHAPATEEARLRESDAQDDERRRLFYVALTRAMDRVILCGASAKGTASPGSWHGMAQAGLEGHLLDAPAPMGDGTIRRYRLAAGIIEPAAAAAAVPHLPAFVLPRWIDLPVPGFSPVATPLAPSGMAQGLVEVRQELVGEDLAGGGTGDAVSAGGMEERLAQASSLQASLQASLQTSLLAGQLAHRLLQHLPAVAEGKRPRVAAGLARRHASALGDDLRGQIAAMALAVLVREDLKPLFGVHSVAEVVVNGMITLPDGRTIPVVGRMDRLAIEGNTVWIADYKSGAGPGGRSEPSASTLAQLAAYHALVEIIYPGHKVRSLAIYLGSGQVSETTAEQRARSLEHVRSP